MTDQLSTCPDVTVVVPTIGRPSLSAAVTSALAQSGVEVRVVVVDDSGEQVVQESDDPRVTVVRSAGRTGPAAARCLGVGLVSSGLVALLDDDDVYLPGHLRRARDFLVSHPGHLYASRALVRYPHGARLEPTVVAEDSTPSDYLFGPDVWRSRRRRVITSTLVTHRRHADFPLDPPQAIGEDTAWLLHAERGGARLHVDPFCGVVMDAEPAREAIRSAERATFRIHEDLSGFAPALSASAYLGRVGRDAARAGRPGAVLRATMAGLRHDRRPSWLAIGAAEMGAASAVALLRRLRRG